MALESFALDVGLRARQACDCHGEPRGPSADSSIAPTECPGRSGNHRGPLPAQDDSDSDRVRDGYRLHALTVGAILSTPSAVRSVRCSHLVRGVGTGWSLSSDIGGRGIVASDLYVALGYRTPLRTSERADHRFDTRAAVSARVLPEPGTIDRIGDTNRALLIDKLSYSLSDFTVWVAQGFIILVLIIFLLVENEMLTAKLIRFFARTPAQTRQPAKSSARSLTRSAHI